MSAPRAYYNENDPKAAAWLRELIAAGHIAPGHVDTRSIAEVSPHDLTAYTQCHFFAGVGGWSLALRLAGVPDSEPLWTGSCPCQPFSSAGKRRGTRDPRHLWPVFRGLIAQCAPAVVLGEQVASKAGRGWLARVRADLEALAYACGAADLCAASLGAPHIRQRLWWVAYATKQHGPQHGPTAPNRLRISEELRHSGEARGMADASHGRTPGHTGALDEERLEPGSRGEARGVGHADAAGSQPGRQTTSAAGYGRPAFADGSARGLGDADGAGCGEQGGHFAVAPELVAAQRAGSLGWSDFDLIPCADGKTRRIESGTFPLAHGVPGRVGLLRGYGNAIVPQVAAVFIRAAFEAVNHCGIRNSEFGISATASTPHSAFRTPHSAFAPHP